MYKLLDFIIIELQNIWSKFLITNLTVQDQTEIKETNNASSLSKLNQIRNHFNSSCRHFKNQKKNDNHIIILLYVIKNKNKNKPKNK